MKTSDKKLQIIWGSFDPPPPLRVSQTYKILQRFRSFSLQFILTTTGVVMRDNILPLVAKIGKNQKSEETHLIKPVGLGKLNFHHVIKQWYGVLAKL